MSTRSRIPVRSSATRVEEKKVSQSVLNLEANTEEEEMLLRAYNSSFMTKPQALFQVMPKGWTSKASLNLMCCCAVINYPALLNEILKDGKIDVNVGDTDICFTPLHWAAWSNSRECIEILLNHPKIDVSLVDLQGGTAIHAAATNNSLDSIRILVADGRINKKQADDKGKKALDMIGMYSKDASISAEIRKLLN